MRHQFLLFTAAMSLALTPLSAGPSDKLTTLDVKETIMIPGKQLPPGKYVMKLMDSASSRHIVMIYNEDQSHLEAILLAIPNSRLQPTGDTVLKYWETPAGMPPALRAWFYPGDSFGQEFAYPKAMAAELSRVNNAKVMYYDGPDKAENSADTFRTAQVYDAPSEATTVATREPTPSNVGTGNNPSPLARPEPTVELAAAPAPTPAFTPDPTPVPSPVPTPAPSPVLMAQNRAVDDPAPAPMDQQMPQTATNIPTLALVGLSLIGLAGMVRVRQIR